MSKKELGIDDAKHARALCATMFVNPSLSLPRALSRKELARILSTTNKMRNDWSGHGGVVGPEDARIRHARLLAEVYKLREVLAGTWAEIELIGSDSGRLRKELFENHIKIYMGSNSEFKHVTREMKMPLDVDRLYLSTKGSDQALLLLPLVQIGPSPPSTRTRAISLAVWILMALIVSFPIITRTSLSF